MTYGIAGNTTKDKLWEPVAALVRWMTLEGHSFRLTKDLSDGLLARELIPEQMCRGAQTDRLADTCDIILSFGGDGTFLHTAYEVGDAGTPILGVNIGRLGFLAETETAFVIEAIATIESDDYTVEKRSCLEAIVNNGGGTEKHFALNEFVLERSGRAGLIAIDVSVNDVPLNQYWADGIIVSTPTGSTAYSLSVGGPIVAPGSEVFILSPIASHSLTIRPIILEDSSVIAAHIETDRQAFVLAADGRSSEYAEGAVDVVIKRARHTINLVRLPNQHFFQTLRNKLMWGVRKGSDLK